MKETPGSCVVCLRDPERVNGWFAECSHVECPHRRSCWSERPTPQALKQERQRDPLRGLFDDPEAP